MFLFLEKGGILIYPIALCSVLALSIFFERLWTYRRMRRGTTELVREVETLAAKGRIEEGIVVCQRTDTPLSRIFLAALRASGRSRNREAAPLERYLGLLSTIATLSPLLGLLGTVLGMIKAFNVIATVGVGTPATLGGGISEALITTVAGLTVAIPTILLHRYLTSRADRMVLEMEEYSLHIVDLLGE